LPPADFSSAAIVRATGSHYTKRNPRQFVAKNFQQFFGIDLSGEEAGILSGGRLSLQGQFMKA
jgi:hypothetical protein